MKVQPCHRDRNPSLKPYDDPGTILDAATVLGAAARIRPKPWIKPLNPNPNSVRLQALDVKLPFDEAELLQENTEYLLRSLKLASIEVHSAEGSQPPPGAPPNAAERLREAVPGAPVVLFSS